MQEIDVTEVIERLEEYAEKHGLKPAQMSRLMGCNSLQQYNNWIYRRSVPKNYLPRAYALLNMGGKASMTTLEIFERVAHLSDSQQEMLLGMLDEFAPKK